MQGSVFFSIPLSKDQICTSYIRAKCHTVCHGIDESRSILPIQRMWTTITSCADIIDADRCIERRICHSDLENEQYSLQMGSVKSMARRCDVSQQNFISLHPLIADTRFYWMMRQPTKHHPIDRHICVGNRIESKHMGSLCRVYRSPPFVVAL